MPEEFPSSRSQYHTTSREGPPSQKKRRQGQRLNAEEKRKAQDDFLYAFALTANVRAACMKAGIDRSQVYRWQERDQVFAQRYKQAEADANDIIRAELFRRAIQGIDVPVLWQGELVKGPNGQPLTLKRYSDSLLALIAKRLPEFKDKLDLSVQQQGGVVVYLPENGRDQKEHLEKRKEL